MFVALWCLEDLLLRTCPVRISTRPRPLSPAVSHLVARGGGVWSGVCLIHSFVLQTTPFLSRTFTTNLRKETDWSPGTAISPDTRCSLVDFIHYSACQLCFLFLGLLDTEATNKPPNPNTMMETCVCVYLPGSCIVLCVDSRTLSWSWFITL